jgi:hypothetical protein
MEVKKGFLPVRSDYHDPYPENLNQTLLASVY